MRYAVGEPGEQRRSEIKALWQKRREYLVPLFVYLRAHHYIASSLALEAGERGGYPIQRIRLAHMRRGSSVTPPWFIEQCCAIVGKSVEEVMGAEWVERFGADGRGGTEAAPVGKPRIQKAPNRPAHYKRRNRPDQHPDQPHQAA